MPAVTPIFAQAVPTSTAQMTLYTAPTARQGFISSVTACNTSGATRWLYLNTVPAGAARDTTNALAWATEIPAGTTMTIGLGVLLGPGERLTCYGGTTAGGVTFTAFGEESDVVAGERAGVLAALAVPAGEQVGVYTVPEGRRSVAGVINVANLSGTAEATVSVFITPPGGVADVTSALYHLVPIPARGHLMAQLGAVLPAGATVSVHPFGADVCATVNGQELG